MRQAVDAFDSDDWVDFFLDLTKRKDISCALPREALRRSFTRLDKEFNRPCMIAMALESLVDGAYIHQVGASTILLSFPVISREIEDVGGFDQPWEAMYYQRFASPKGKAYFTKWIGIYNDAVTATPGSAAIVGSDHFTNWKQVLIIAARNLDRAVRVVHNNLERESATGKKG